MKQEIQKFKTLKSWTAIVILFLSYSNATAQESRKEINYQEIIYVEADPFAYINKGYSIHLGYENWGYRFDLTKVKVDFPESFEEAFYDTKSFDLITNINGCLLYTSPSPRDQRGSRMPSSA